MTNTVVRPFCRAPELENSGWYQGHTLMTFLATAQDTGGRLSLTEITSRHGADPPAHIHPDAEECFYILDGEMEFVIEDERLAAGPGEFVVIPRGRLHQPIVKSTEARTLVFFVPGGAESYFQEMVEPAGALTLPPEGSGQPDVQRVIETATRHGGVFPDLPGEGE